MFPVIYAKTLPVTNLVSHTLSNLAKDFRLFDLCRVTVTLTVWALSFQYRQTVVINKHADTSRASDVEIAERVVCGISTVTRIRRRFVEGNQELALSEAPQCRFQHKERCCAAQLPGDPVCGVFRVPGRQPPADAGRRLPNPDKAAVFS